MKTTAKNKCNNNINNRKKLMEFIQGLGFRGLGFRVSVAAVRSSSSSSRRRSICSSSRRGGGDGLPCSAFWP